MQIAYFPYLNMSNLDEITFSDVKVFSITEKWLTLKLSEPACLSNYTSLLVKCQLLLFLVIDCGDYIPKCLHDHFRCYIVKP
jgi:hypothetical protein